MSASLLKIKCDKIRQIQARGLRVLLLQSGGILVWDKSDPDLEWGYPNLDAAIGDIEGWFASERRAEGVAKP